MVLSIVPHKVKDEGVASAFVQRCNENYGKEGKMSTSFITWTILRKGNLTVHFYDINTTRTKFFNESNISK